MSTPTISKDIHNPSFSPFPTSNTPYPLEPNSSTESIKTDNDEFATPPSNPSFLIDSNHVITPAREKDDRTTSISGPSTFATDTPSGPTKEADLPAFQHVTPESELMPTHDAILDYLWNQVVEPDLMDYKEDFTRFVENQNPRPLIDRLLWDVLGDTDMEPPRPTTGKRDSKPVKKAHVRTKAGLKKPKYNKRARQYRLW